LLKHCVSRDLIVTLFRCFYWRIFAVKAYTTFLPGNSGPSRELVSAIKSPGHSINASPRCRLRAAISFASARAFFIRGICHLRPRPFDQFSQTPDNKQGDREFFFKFLRTRRAKKGRCRWKRSVCKKLLYHAPQNARWNNASRYIACTCFMITHRRSPPPSLPLLCGARRCVVL